MIGYMCIASARSYPTVRYEDFVDHAERVCRCLLTFALSPSGLREGGRRERAFSRTNATSNDANILADDLHCDGGCKSGSAHTYPFRGGEAKAPDLDEQVQLDVPSRTS